MLQLLPEQDIEDNERDTGKNEIPLADMDHRFNPFAGVEQEHVELVEWYKVKTNPIDYQTINKIGIEVLSTR